MPLPFPHGDASGQIGHMANYSTSDTPTSTGGRFIGFGEPGTSEVGNRAHWALSSNIDYVHTKITQEIAVPKGYDRTSPGGGESTFQFPTGEEIWMGDDSYPGSAGSSDLEGMHMLFDVLDANYNELTDGADNEIRVKLVRESTNTTDMYQGGSPFVDSFQDQPIIHFIAVDPATGATVTDPYTIPAATNYKVQCGVKSSIAELPADALVRYKVQGASEVEAGTFLQDGTRPMTGNLDLDGNNLINADVVSNVTGEPLDISSDHNLLFKDQYLSAGLALSESGQTALYQPVDALVYPSLVGAVNSGVEAQEFAQGDRSMDRTGTFTTGSAPAMTHPAITVSLGGQILHFASDTVTASGGGDGQYYLYVTAAGVLSFGKFANWAAVIAASAGAIPIWTGELTGLETSWDGPIDLRWAGTAGKHGAVYVGTGVGADFASLNDAANFLAVTAYGVEDTNVNCEIVVVGESEVQSTVTLLDGWTLRGLSRHGHSDQAPSVVTTDTDNFPLSSNVVVAGDNCIVRDLAINWGRDSDQIGDAYGLSVGVHCRVEGVRFTKSTNKFDRNLNLSGNTTDKVGHVIRECYFDKFADKGVRAYGVGRVHVENCTFVSDGTPVHHVDMTPATDTADGRGPTNIIMGCYFKGSASSSNIVVGGPNVLIDSCQAELTGSTTPFILISGEESQEEAGVTVRNCLLENGYQLVYCAIDSSVVNVSAIIESCTIVGFSNNVFDFNCTSINEYSNIVVRGCNLHGQTAGYLARFNNARNVSVLNSQFSGVSTGILIDGDTTACIDGNKFVGNGSTTEIAIETDSGDTRVVNNSFSAWTVNCVLITGSGNFYVGGNIFDSCCTKSVTIGAITDVQASAVYIGSATTTVVTGNMFSNLSGSAIRGSYTDDLTISDNSFVSVEGRYLDTGPLRTKYAAVAVSDPVHLWAVTNNRFRECGHAYTAAESDQIVNHGVYVDAAVTGHISGNSFKDFVASSRDDVAERYLEIGLWGNGDAICANNSFYKDTDDDEIPYSGYSQIYYHGTGNLVITGCHFHLIGTSTFQAVATFACVRAASGSVHACGCYSEGTWSQTPAGERIWDLEGCTDGAVVGCTFRGNNDVYISQTTGFSVGNVHTGQSGKTFTVGAFPSTGQYDAILNTSNPKADFNRQM